MRHTPGPWRLLAIVPSDKCQWFKTPEGYDGIYSQTDTEPHVHIQSTTDHMNNVFGSGEGGHIAELPMTYGDEGRQQALANAEFIVTACNAHDDLVEALAEALYIVDIGYESGGTPVWSLQSDSTKEIWRRKALAKAKGQE